METREWSYEEFPEFREDVPGAVRLKTTGEEMGVHLFSDVKYAEVDGHSLYLQILQPFTRNEPEQTYPCLVYVQGSAWMEQETKHGLPLLANLARWGYVIAVVQYRHSGIAAFPAQIQDTKNAIRFLRKYAARYGIHPDQILVGGSSSGGHTAVFCDIIKDGDPRDRNLYPGISAEVKGILDYYGACSLMEEDAFPSTTQHHLPESPEGRLMGHVNLREHPELCEQASAQCQITPELPMAPTAIFHGTKDRTVNTRASVLLYQKMKACGKDVRLYLLEGADHGGAEFWTEEMCGIADEFMRYCLSR